MSFFRGFFFLFATFSRQTDYNAFALTVKKSVGVAKKFPLVRFNVPGGGHRYMWVQAENFKVEQLGDVLVNRSQVRLCLFPICYSA